jgi:hypothetical protein
MIPLFPKDDVFHVCRKVYLDTFEEHATYCRELLIFKYKHDLIKNVKHRWTSWLTHKKGDWHFGGCFGVWMYMRDLTGVFPIFGLGVRDFMVWRTTLKAASSKMVKHKNLCFDNQHIFILFIFYTFDFLAPDGVDILKRIQWVMHYA